MKIFIGILLLGVVFAKRKQCGRNELFKECGTACPLTCDNLNNPPEVCAAVCVSGCQCKEGFVKSGSGGCVKPENCLKPRNAEIQQQDCIAQVDPGSCKAFNPRFYYDPAEERCKEFVYGGCGGNRNNFKTEEECKTTCGALFGKSRTACIEDKEVGPCRAALPRFFFNKETGQCERFTYGGCEGNSNNFNSQEDCEAVCNN